jgi:hypothetical protein
MVTIHEAGFQTVAIFMQNGELEKKEPAANAVSDNVEDSSNKIFIGGFSKAISSEMLMEIVSVFGPLKAYRFVSNNDLNQRCAFLEVRMYFYLWPRYPHLSLPSRCSSCDCFISLIFHFPGSMGRCYYLVTFTE